MTEPRRIGKWTPKMTPESIKYAMEKLGCKVTSTQVARDIEDKFGIKISDCRLRALRDSKRWFPVFKAAEDKFLATCSDDTTVQIAAKVHRLKVADKVAGKLVKLIDRIDTKIDDLTDTDGIRPETAKYVLALAKTLRETAKTYREFLQYAREETKVEKHVRGVAGSGSFLTQINIQPKAEEVPKIIDVKVERND